MFPGIEPVMIQPQAPMHRRAVLRCDGSLEAGFRVALEISDRTLGVISEAVGELPAAFDLLTALSQWRQSYRQSLAGGSARISLESVTIETGSLSQLEDCRSLSKRLESDFGDWLAAPGFQAIDQRLRESLNVQDEVEILLRTRDRRLHQLPWHCWGFIQRYPKAELVLSLPSERLETTVNPAAQVRILAILGDRQGIDTDSDQQILEQTPNAAVIFLVEPSRQLLYRHLWEHSWDILFFAGHSHTSDQQGILHINPNEQLNLEDLKYGLKKAIGRGLKLAIFNSCDGLGLADALGQLHIPQFIVMREPVPDRVAQEFLKRFLPTFAAGESLHTSVRQAKEWLQSLEGDFPCASWLPILFHNSAMESLNWQQITQPQAAALPLVETIPATRSLTKPRRLRLRGMLAISLLVGSLVIGGRSLGLWQRSELWAYDQMLQLQWHTAKVVTPDTPKIRVIGITAADIQKYGQGMTEANIISDRALARLITKINQYQPQVIGLDIFRDTPQPDAAGYQQLLQTLIATPNVVLACQIGEDDQAEQQAIPSIAAPKLSPPKAAIGYADGLLPDADMVVRRYVLQMPPRSGAACESAQSFAWQIASQIYPAPRVNTILEADFGGYQDDPAQFGDDQILVNYHASSRNLRLYSLQEILYLNTESELTQLFKDSVVLIGYNLGGTEDTHATPIGSQNGVMVHTHVIRQLLGQTPMIRSSPQWGELLGMMLGALMGGGLLWRVRSARRRIGLAIVILLGSQILVYVAALQSFWLPVVPATVALLLTLVLLWLLEQKVPLMSKSSQVSVERE
jgi:CHASE2 domain-containing sensor protein